MAFFLLQELPYNAMQCDNWHTIAGPPQWTPGGRLVFRVLRPGGVRGGRCAQVPWVARRPAGPGRAQGDADCDQHSSLTSDTR